MILRVLEIIRLYLFTIRTIAQVQSYKYLGVYIDKSLTWDMHVHWVCERLSQRLSFLRRLWFYGVDSKIILLFYQSVLESVIRYG